MKDQNILKEFKDINERLIALEEAMPSEIKGTVLKARDALLAAYYDYLEWQELSRSKRRNEE